MFGFFFFFFFTTKYHHWVQYVILARFCSISKGSICKGVCFQLRKRLENSRFLWRMIGLAMHGYLISVFCCPVLPFPKHPFPKRSFSPLRYLCILLFSHGFQSVSLARIATLLNTSHTAALSIAQQLSWVGWSPGRFTSYLFFCQSNKPCLMLICNMTIVPPFDTPPGVQLSSR